MSENVDYSSIVVNFSTTMQKLNAVAMEFAEKKNSAIKVQNLAFSDAEDPKQAKFIGGGQYRLIGGMKDESAEVLSKKDFSDVFAEYTSWFCGKEEASYVKEQMLAPIYKSENSESKEENKDKGETNEVSESFHSVEENNLLNLLFETNDDKNKNDTKKPSDPNEKINDPKDKDKTTDGDKEESNKKDRTDGSNDNNEDNKPEDENNKKEEKSKNDKQNEQKLIGYSLGYDISVNGQKSHDLKDAIANKSSGLLGGIWSDLKSIHMDIGGKTYNVGKVFDPETWKKAAGIVDIDKDRVADNVKKAMDHDFNSNDVDVRCMGGNTITTYLNRKGKLTPQLKSKIEKVPYSVVISVNQKDPNYPKYNQKTIAASASKGFGTTKQLIDRNKVKVDDVIEIDNIESLYKTRSAYDQKQKHDYKERSSDNETSTTKKDTKPQKSKKQVKEEEEEIKKQEFQNTENKQEETVKDDTELEKLVKSQEYKDFITKTLEEQCNIELKEDEHTCKYSSTDEITDDMMKKGVNDLELLKKIKNKGEQSYYVTVTKDLKEAVNETISIEKNLLKLLFEDVVEVEDMIEEADEQKNEKALEVAVDCINVTGDEKKDTETKGRIKSGVKNLMKVDKVEKQIKGKCERVIKNTIIKALDQFKTDRNFEDLDTNCFITSAEKENLDEAIHTSVLKHFLKLNESLTLEVEKDDEMPQEVADMNAILVGRLNKGLKSKSKDLHVDPYCAITSSDRVSEYIKKHNLCDEKIRTEILKKPYCAIVIAKRGIEIDGRKVEGSRGESFLTDSNVNAVLDDICGKKNKIPVINCKDQSRDTMDKVQGDLIAKKLSFYSEGHKGKGENPNYISNPSDRHVPELDVWLRPFDLDDSILKKQDSIPDPSSIIEWFVVLPDPIPVEKDKDKSKTDNNDDENGEYGDNSNDNQTDWYIIPHEKIKDTNDGITSEKPSNNQ